LDFLNFLASPAFSIAQDVEYSNARGPLVSHSWYFKEEKFWKLVRKLMAQGLAPPGKAEGECWSFKTREPSSQPIARESQNGEK
jgi:hypothetical protein